LQLQHSDYFNQIILAKIFNNNRSLSLSKNMTTAVKI
jgi:hypothetical protein